MATLNDWMVVVNYGIGTMCSAAASAYAEEVLPVINGGLADSCACTRIAAFKAAHNLHPKLLLDDYLVRLLFSDRPSCTQLVATLQKGVVEPFEVRRSAAYALALLEREEVVREALTSFCLDVLDVLDEKPFSELHASCLVCAATLSMLNATPRLMATIVRTLQHSNVAAILKACEHPTYLLIAHANIQRATLTALMASDCNNNELRAIALKMGMPLLSLRYIMQLDTSHTSAHADATMVRMRL
jgi:hypothetical protein